MALENIYDGDGADVTFDITFNYLEEEDINVAVKPSGGSYATKTLTEHYNVNGQVVTFTSSHVPPNNSKVRIRRATLTSQPRHTFYAGSSVTAASLNTNYKQILYALEEFKELNAATLVVEVANDSITLEKMDDNSVGSDQYVDSSIKTAHIDNDQVTADKLANSINTEIAANTAKVTNATHTGEVTGATALTVANDVIDSDNLKTSNPGSNGEFLSKQSGNTGGLTWASLVGAAPAGWQIGFGYASTTTKKDFTEDNTWQDSGLEITYTPKSSSSLLLIEARPILRARPDGDTRDAYFEVRYELDNSGNDLDGAMGFTYGHSADNAAYAYYVATANQPMLITTVYTNSNTNQKIFKLQCRAPTYTTDFEMNTDTAYYGLSTGKSYITIKEIAN